MHSCIGPENRHVIFDSSELIPRWRANDRENIYCYEKLLHSVFLRKLIENGAVFHNLVRRSSIMAECSPYHLRHCNGNVKSFGFV